ncbi:unnamed protein product [Didymodactylos carnosus]|uniref:RRM domain-containing protein n=1 Tax=Didymodactylos carnosus TaxID=1234261 RepID=A0A814CZC2_9BILA|nr:unnamed protein product [Didymodactylos carnosus]CAF0947379.1 unnamed protein product [Didymodactylos carnosus]CAF3694465.1 unnamed protein product [Didymodactylos carnosus]CAF3723402.1 unnamed protein product [Didymodactylos carnosus]
MASLVSSRVIQISNVSCQCMKDQLKALFSFFGRIDDLQLYPDSDTVASTVNGKVGFIKFDRLDAVYGALNMTNTIFIDKPLIITQVFENSIPDETEAMNYCAPLNPNVTLIPGGPTWPSTVINRIVGQGPQSLIETFDPELTDKNLPPYPSLPGSLDHSKAEEIRRTVYLSNIDKNVGLDVLHEFLSQIGEIRFIRAAYTDENADVRGAYVEFSEQPSIPKVLSINGFSLFGRPLKVNHSTSCVIKPATTRGLRNDDDEGSRSRSRTRSQTRLKTRTPSPIVKRSKDLISSSFDDLNNNVTSTSNNRRSSSRGKRRSRSTKRRHGSSSKSRSKHRSRSKSRTKSSKAAKSSRRSSKSPSSRSKKRSRSRRRSRSKSRDRKKEKSRSKKRSRTRSKSRSKKDSSSARKRSRSKSKVVYFNCIPSLFCSKCLVYFQQYRTLGYLPILLGKWPKQNNYVKGIFTQQLRTLDTSPSLLLRNENVQTIYTQTVNISKSGRIEIKCPFNLYITPTDVKDFPRGDKAFFTIYGDSGFKYTKEFWNKLFKFSAIFNEEDKVLHINGQFTELGFKELLEQAHTLEVCCELPSIYELDIHCLDNNNVNVEYFDCPSVNITTKRGGCSMKNIVANSIVVHSQSGNITCSGSMHGAIDLSTERDGVINASKLQGSFIRLKMEDGTIQVKSVYSDHFLIQGRKGNLLLRKLQGRGIVDLNRGSIKIKSMDGDISVQCEIGDVDAFFSTVTGLSTIRAQNGMHICDVQLGVIDTVPVHLSLVGKRVQIAEEAEGQMETTKKRGMVHAQGFISSKSSSTIDVSAPNGTIALNVRDWFSTIKLDKHVD